MTGPKVPAIFLATAVFIENSLVLISQTLRALSYKVGFFTDTIFHDTHTFNKLLNETFAQGWLNIGQDDCPTLN